jgi:hypothetical protein
MSRLQKAAYGKDIKGAGGIINAGSRIGVKIVQLVYLRPPIYGYKKAVGGLRRDK